MAFGLLAWRDALREVRAFLKAPSAPGTGGSCVIHPPRYWDYHYCYRGVENSGHMVQDRPELELLARHA